MFCGVAPFSIMIAKYAHPRKIIAVDKNPFAIKLAKKNIKENKLSSKVNVICEDAENTELILSKENIVPDHIIMNLPFSAFEFFPLAVKSISNNGIIHYYDIIDEILIDKRCDELIQIADENNRDLEKMKVHKIKTYAPHEFYIGIDITVSKN
jgi:tRNA (guanine37-N1)-methyltransferase